MRYRWALWALFCGTVAGQTLPDEASLTVILKGERVPEPILNAMRRETQAAVEPSGVHLSWRLQDLPSGEVPGQVALIEMRGRCASTTPLPRPALRGDAEPLAQTHMVDGKVLPFADLLCDAVHRLVDRDLRGVRSNQRDELLGRAYGRVLAHELYHILARTSDHGDHGLGRWEQSSAELLSPSSSFAETDERRMADSRDR
jgi:hypothetical protein